MSAVALRSPVAAPRGGRREQLARLASSTGLLQVAHGLRPLWLRDVRVLAYHRVLESFDEASFPFDPELVSATAEDFDWQMRLVARDYDPITCADLADAIDGGAPLPRRPVLVTFDDGFADNYEHAFPILMARGVPATVFLTTGYVGVEGTYWFDWVSYVMARTPRERMLLPGVAEPFEIGKDAESRRRATETLLKAAKQMTNERRHALLAQLRQQAGVDLASVERLLSRPMDWSQVREMARAGIEFGSHTVTHPVLARIGNDLELRNELVQSKSAIEQAIGRPVDAIAYPVGGESAYDERVIEAVQAVGYRIAFSYRPGLNRAGAMERWALRRTAVERYISRQHFAARLALPEVFASER